MGCLTVVEDFAKGCLAIALDTSLPKECVVSVLVRMAEFRDECLNERGFLSMRHAREIIACWRQAYNEGLPHSSLDDQMPKKCADQLLTKDSRPTSP